jgi:hypothetical protein
MARALLKASLPAPTDCGLFKASDHAAMSWWVSVSGCLSDPLLFELREGLSEFAEPAFTALVSLVGGADSKYWASVSHLFPSSGSGLLDGTTYAPALVSTTKVGKSVLRCLGKQRLALYRASTAPDGIDGCTFTKADAIAAAAKTSAGRIFNEPFRKYQLPFAFSNSEYVAFCRFFFALPPPTTIGGLTSQPGYDYAVQKCLSRHGNNIDSFIDAGACHASSNCPATSDARIKKHTNIVRSLCAAARQAGLKVKSEPDSHALLLGEFSKEDCRRIFPAHASVEYKSQFKQLMKTVISVSECKDSYNENQALLQEQIRLLPQLKDKDTTGLRLDLAVEDPISGESLWIDASVVHTTCTSYVSQEFFATTQRRLSQALADECRLPDVLKFEPSPSLVTREVAKTEKYSRLLSVAAKQYREGRRTKPPTFSPFVLSDFGELGRNAQDVHEWLVGKFKKHHKNQFRTDGLSIDELVRAYRHNLKLSVQFAVASGIGAMILAAGQPWKGVGSI